MADVFVLLDVAREQDGSGVVAVGGTIEFCPVVRRVEDSAVVVPDSFSVALVAGDPAPTVTLTKDDGTTWAWQVLERIPAGVGSWQTFTVSDVPDDGTIAYADLTALDPETLLPLPEVPTVGEAIAAEEAAREAGDAALSARLDPVEGTGGADTQVWTADGTGGASWQDAPDGNVADLDAATAALVDDDASATQASLNAGYAPLGKTSPARSSTVATLGDSITSYNGDVGFQNPGWFWRLICYSNGRMRPEPVTAMYANGGYTLQDMIDNRLPLIEALAQPPGFTFCAGGSNDLADAGGATYLSSPEATQAKMLEIVLRLQQIGSTPILVKVPPRQAVPQIAANVVAWNAWIDSLAQARGLAVLDMCAPLATDPEVADTFKSGTNLDDTHPSALGHDYIARYAIETGILDLFPQVPSLNAPTWHTQLMTTSVGRFMTDANSDGIADGWGTGGTITGVTFSREAAEPGDGALGYWQVINIPASPSASGWFQHGSVSSADWAPGDRIRVRFKVQATGVTGAAALANGLSLGFATFSPQVTVGANGWFHDIPNGEFNLVGEVPAGATLLYVRFSWNTGTPNPITLRIANVRLENLSRTPFA